MQIKCSSSNFRTSEQVAGWMKNSLPRWLYWSHFGFNWQMNFGWLVWNFLHNEATHIGTFRWVRSSLEWHQIEVWVSWRHTPPMAHRWLEYSISSIPFRAEIFGCLMSSFKHFSPYRLCNTESLAGHYHSKRVRTSSWGHAWHEICKKSHWLLSYWEATESHIVEIF